MKQEQFLEVIDRDEAERIKKDWRGETGIDGFPGEKVEGAFAEALGIFAFLVSLLLMFAV